MALEQDSYAYPGARYSKDGMPIGNGQGMTMRDWFAGQALTGMISTAAAPCLRGVGQAEDAMAKAAYKIADAMIENR